eukprot:g2969.t1
MTVRTTCQKNTTGLLCAQCQPGFGKAVGHCVKCPAVIMQIFVALTFGAMAIGLAVVVTRKSLQDELDTEVATVSVLRISLNFLMMTSFLAGLKLDWGTMLRTIFNVAKASSGGLPPFTDCLGLSFEKEMVFSLLLPLCVPVTPLCALVSWAIWQRLKGRNPLCKNIWRVSKMRFFVNGCVSMAYILWPVVTFQVLRILDCSVEINGIRYVATSTSTPCYEGAHRLLFGFAVLELVLVVPALPFFLWHRLRRYPVGDGTFNRSHFYFLYGGYREGMEYWEAVVMARKFLVLATTVFLARDKFGMQVAASTWIMCGATLLQLLYKPYQNHTEQVLETRTIAAITMCCMIGQLMYMAGERGLGKSGMQLCRAVIGILIISTMCLCIVYFIREVSFAVHRKQKSSRADAGGVKTITAGATEAVWIDAVSDGGSIEINENPISSHRQTSESLTDSLEFANATHHRHSSRGGHRHRQKSTKSIKHQAAHDSPGAAAPTSVVAHVGRQRHESSGADEEQVRKRVRSDAEEDLRNRARTIFNTSQGPNTVPAEPQRRAPTRDNVIKI